MTLAKRQYISKWAQDDFNQGQVVQSWVKITRVSSKFEFRYENLKSKIQFNSFCQQFDDCVATLKRIEKIVQENAFDEKKKRPRLKFNPGIALIGLRTTGPWRIK